MGHVGKETHQLAKRTIGWSPRHGLQSIVGTVWNWHSKYLPALTGQSGQRYQFPQRRQFGASTQFVNTIIAKI
jgi:hypothetical protein